MSSAARGFKLRRQSSFLLPGLAAGVGGGLLAGVQPLLAGGLAVSVILVLLPWNMLFALFSFLSITQSAKTGGGGFSLNGIVVGGLTFRPAMAAVVPFAIRAYLVTNPALRNRWKLPEFMLLGYWVLLIASTFSYSPQLNKSLPTIGLIAFGLIAFYAVFAATASPERLRVATKIFVIVVLLNAMYGIFATVAHFALHTHFGISTNSDFGPGVFGLSYEHDIFASTCGAGAVMFFAFWREPNRLMSSRLAWFGFFVCSIAMLLGLARAAWIGYTVAMFGMVFLTRRAVRAPVRFGRIGVVLLGGVVVVVLASYVFISATSGSAAQNNSVLGGIKGKFEELFNVQTGTGRGRTSEFKTAVADLSESPLIGLGANTYGMHHPIAKGKNNYIGDLWVRALYESGAFGLILLLGAVVLIVWPNRVVRSSNGPTATIARALTFGFVVLVIAYAGTDDTLYMWPWILLGLVRASRVLAEREYRAARAARVPALAGAGAGDGSMLLPGPVAAVPIEGPAAPAARALRPRRRFP